ncbi:MAG TPA: PD-(D/E)XK nuclease family protein [Elusimicrobiota bacterium]|nr:PD-(D/E)XK nuclease family protein [Elusimicrobiota bacterium]
MLTVFCGPFQPALEDAFVERLRGLAATPAAGLPPPIAVVTPSRALADRLERLAAVERGLPLINVHFHTFFSLALATLEGDSALTGKTLLGDSVFFDKLMDGLLDSHPELARPFGGAERPKALARSLRSSLRDLIDAGAAPAQVLEHFGAELEAGGAERQKLAALLRLAFLYEQRQESLSVLSSSALARLAARRAEEGSAFLGRFREILYYGFYDLTGLQADFFEAVAKNYPAALFFPYRRRHPAFTFAEAFFEQKILGLAAERKDLEPQTGKTALGPALDRLFSMEGASADLAAENARPAPAAKLRVMSASGARDEAWLCAKEIIVLVRAGACRYEDVGVMTRSLEPYRAAVAEAFQENAIPYAMSAREPLLREPFAKAAWTVLSIRRRDFPARSLEELFFSPYFRLPDGASEGMLHRWRILIERLQIRAGWLQWEGKLKDRAREDFEVKNADGEVLFNVPQNETAALWDAVAGLKAAQETLPASWREAARATRATVSRSLRLPEDASETERAAADAVWDILASLEMFDRLGRAPSWDEVLDVLEEKFKNARSAEPEPRRGVRVMDVMAGRGESFKVLFLLGLKEKSFPRDIREDPLLRDAERAFLRQPVGCWVGLKSAGYEEERLLFYLAAASARETLYCVYPRSDEAGKAEVPSFYLLQLCRAAGLEWGEKNIYRRAARSPAQKIAECPPEGLSPREVSLRLALAGQNPGPYLSAAGRSEEAALAEAGLSRLPRFSAWSPPGPLDGLVGPPAEYLRELSRRGLSPSAYKTFLECPFQFFAERVLGLGSIEEAPEKDALDKKARGKIYHKILERFYRTLAASGPKTDAPAGWENILGRAVDEVFAEHSWRVLGLYPVLWESEKRAMGGHARGFAAWDLARASAGGWRPDAFEEDLRAPWPGKPPEALQDLFLHGRLDRLDIDSSGRRFCVVDYKTKISDYLKKEKTLQLSFYAELAQAKLGSQAEMDAALLAGVEAAGPRARADAYAGAAWRKDRAAFWAAADKNLARLAEGRFPIRPDAAGDGGWGHCVWCGFSSLCRKSHGPSRRRAEQALGEAAAQEGAHD